jgi:hypothetical protein
MRRAALVLLGLLSLPLAGCDLLGIETLSQQQARRAAEGKAIGSACRHAGWGPEDCYRLNPEASKPAMFAGWKEMNEYMAKNSMEAVAPTIGPNGIDPAKKAKADEMAQPAKAPEAGGPPERKADAKADTKAEAH